MPGLSSNDGAHQTEAFPIRQRGWRASEMVFPTRHDRAGNSPSIRALNDPICSTSYKPPCLPVRLLSESRCGSSCLLARALITFTTLLLFQIYGKQSAFYCFLLPNLLPAPIATPPTLSAPRHRHHHQKCLQHSRSTVALLVAQRRAVCPISRPLPASRPPRASTPLSTAQPPKTSMSPTRTRPRLASFR